MNQFTRLGNMERCPYCKTILNTPTSAARNTTVDGVRWIITTTRRACPGCGWTRDTDRYTRAFVQDAVREGER